MNSFDLHLHTDYSDGEDSPSALVRKAKALGLSLIAVTDHDTVKGVAEGAAAGREAGVLVLPGVELSTQYSAELHILGLGVDTSDAALLAALEANAVRRGDRNAATLARLAELGMDVRPLMEYGRGTTTRLAIAAALAEAGFAASPADAFRRLLDRGGIAYVPTVRMDREEAIRLIHGAGGRAVIAHPFQSEREPRRLITELADMGLDGVEVFYPHTSDGQRLMLLSLARQLKLLVTCGSDYHGSARPAQPGCTWAAVPELEAAYALFAARAAL